MILIGLNPVRNRIFNWLFFLLINFGVLLISALIIFGSSFLMSIKGPATTIRWE